MQKFLHHFYNTRLTEEQLEKLDNLLTSAACDLYGLYKSTTSLVIYLPREHGGIGVKRISDVCSHLDTKTLFGCQSDWLDMLRYARKLDSCSLQKVLFRLTVDRDLEKARQLSVHGPYLCLSGIQLKSSHLVLYNWSIQDSLCNLLSKHV